PPPPSVPTRRSSDLGVTVGIDPSLLFLIGSSATFTALGPCTLFLGINDNNASDNFGSFTATVTGSVLPGSVFTSTSTGIVLSNPTTQNPATLLAGNTVTNTTTAHSGDGVFGTGAAAWTFTNLGTISATQATANGIEL